MNVLQINTSARQAASHSSRLAAEVVEALRANNAKLKLTLRDLGQNPHAPLDEAGLGALFTPAEARSPEQAARVAENDALIAELQAHDVIVMTAPMINFGVPSQLKNWIDAVARAGVTFKYTATGPVGLVTGKKVIVVSTRGGIHRDQPTDGVTPYLRTFLGFLGLSDVDFVFAEGLGMGPDAEAKGLADARVQIAELFNTATV